MTTITVEQYFQLKKPVTAMYKSCGIAVQVESIQRISNKTYSIVYHLNGNRFNTTIAGYVSLLINKGK